MQSAKSGHLDVCRFVLGRSWHVAMLVSTATSLCVGCGPRTDRLPVGGKVTLDGAPLDSGSIRFTSVGTENIMASGGMIREGQYDIPQEHGLRPGTYHVEISSPDTKGPPIMLRERPGERGIPVQRERIPSEYNDKSKKRIEVTIDGSNQFDFDIVSRTAK